MGRGRRAHNRNSRQHTNHRYRAAPFTHGANLKQELAEALPEAPDGLVGEIARAATLSSGEATRILRSRARKEDGMGDEDVKKAREVIENHAREVV